METIVSTITPVHPHILLHINVLYIKEGIENGDHNLK